MAPAAPLWGLLLPADRARVLEWIQGARAATQTPSIAPSTVPTPVREPTAGAGLVALERLVSDMQAERRRAMLVRVWRDTGAFAAAASVGTGVALYVRPPLTLSTTGAAIAWFIALAMGVRYVTRCAKGRGILGTSEGNATYFACPERYAMGGLYSASLGAGLGIATMVAALVAKAF